jgi:hypothetical protein
MVKNNFKNCKIGGGIVVKNHEGYFVRSHPDFLKDFSHDEHVFIMEMQTAHDFGDVFNWLMDNLEKSLNTIKKQSDYIKELKLENEKLKKMNMSLPIHNS